MSKVIWARKRGKRSTYCKGGRSSLQQGHVLTGMGERWLPLRESAKFQKAKKEKGLDKDTSLNTG